MSDSVYYLAEDPHLRPRIGLALGGGGARGWAHIGALEVLIEEGIEPDLIAGSSIGALVGGSYLAGKLQDLKSWALALNRRSILGYLDFRLGGGGFLAGERLARKLNEHLENVRIEDLSRPFTAVTAELATGHEVWLRKPARSRSADASMLSAACWPSSTVCSTWWCASSRVPFAASLCAIAGSWSRSAKTKTWTSAGGWQPPFAPALLGCVRRLPPIARSWWSVAARAAITQWPLGARPADDGAWSRATR